MIYVTREESLLDSSFVEDPTFVEEAQLIDVREHDEVCMVFILFFRILFSYFSSRFFPF